MPTNPRPCNKFCELCPSKPPSSAGSQQQGDVATKAVSVLPSQAGSALVRAAVLCNTSSSRLSERQSIEEEMAQRMDKWKQATVWKSWQRYLSARWSGISCHDWRCNCEAPFTVQVKPSYKKPELNASMKTHRPHSVAGDQMARRTSVRGSYCVTRDKHRQHNYMNRVWVPSAHK